MSKIAERAATGKLSLRRAEGRVVTGVPSHRKTAWCLGCLLLAFSLSGAEASQPANPARKADQVTCSARVLDAQGKPVADASAVLYEVKGDRWPHPSKVSLLQEKRTGTDGALTFSVPQEGEDAGAGYIIIQKEGFAITWIDWWMGEDQEYDVTMGKPAELAGMIVDEEGKPVAGAQVRIDHAFINRGEEVRDCLDGQVSDIFRVQTDAEGRFVFARIPAEATFDLRVEKPGRAALCARDMSTQGEKGRFSPGQTDIRVTLPAEAKIQGIVVEKATGKPMNGIQVVPEPEDATHFWTIRPVASAQNGGFSVGGLMPGHYTMQLVRPAQGMEDWVTGPVDVNLAAGATAEGIKLELVKGGIVEVLVKDSENGEPVADARVGVDRLGHQSWDGTTDKNGLARFRLLPGEHSVDWAYREGYTTDQPVGGKVNIVEGETQRITCTLSPEAKVAGIVRDLTGRPLGGVELVILGDDPEDVDATTDSNGKFEMSWDSTWLDANRRTTWLMARDDKHNLATAVQIDAQSRSLDVKLQPGVTLIGKVTDDKGKPLAEAQVLSIRLVASAGPLWQATTGADGSFEITALPTMAEYGIRAWAEGYGILDTSVDGHNVKDLRLNTGTLRMLSANLSVSGAVVDPEGKPVPDAEILCSGPGQPACPPCRADSQGRFTIDGVCAGRLKLLAMRRGGTRAYGQVETEGGAMDVRIVVSRSGTDGGYVPKKPASLVGQPLPGLKTVGVELPPDANDRMLLVCLADMNQRPSRHCLAQLAQQTTQLREKEVMIVAVQAAPTEEDAWARWREANKGSFPAGRVTGDFEKARFDWAATSLPHLILTNRKHAVVAEGFELSELDRKILMAADQR